MAFYIDLPIPDKCKAGAEDCWTQVATVNTKAQAIKWIREHVGRCDDEGRVCLVEWNGEGRQPC